MNRERLSDLFQDLNSKYSDQFNFKCVGDAIQIKVKYKSDWLQSGELGDENGTYRDDGHRGGFDYYDDQAQNYIREGQKEDDMKDQTVRTDFDWAKNAASLIGFMRKEGNMSLEPLPEIILNKTPQSNGLLEKTADYNPVDKVITLYTHGRHPKDVLRSLGHELVHSQQDIDGRIGNVETDRMSDSKELAELEDEATRKGYALFRKWTESLRK